MVRKRKSGKSAQETAAAEDESSTSKPEEAMESTSIPSSGTVKGKEEHHPSQKLVGEQQSSGISSTAASSHDIEEESQPSSVPGSSKGRKRGKGTKKVDQPGQIPVGEEQSESSITASGPDTEQVAQPTSVPSSSKSKGKGKGHKKEQQPIQPPVDEQQPSGKPSTTASGRGLWKAVDADGPRPPKRPSRYHCGDAGGRIKLCTNHFEVNVRNPDITLYHYNVTIKDHRDSETLPRNKKMKVFEEFKRSFPKIFTSPMAYDSMKNAYSTHSFPQFVVSKGKKAVPYEVEVDFEEGQKNKSKFKVSIEKVNEASLRTLMAFLKGAKMDMPSTLIQMVEVMFRHYPSNKYEQVAGRNFFSLVGDFGPAKPIGGAKDGVSGFFGSFRPSCWKDGSLLLNIDMANTAFYRVQPVAEFIREHLCYGEFNEGSTLEPVLSRKMDKLLKNLKIRVTHAPRTYRFNKILPQGADKTTFTLTTDSGSRKCTVQEYMRMQYGVILKFPKLNCLHLGNIEKSIYIPMELCQIAKGQRVMKKLTDKETSEFIRLTAIPPEKRLEKICNVAKANKFNDDPMLKALSFTISDKPLQTEGRVLPAPGLKMDRNFEPRQGQWDMRDKKFYEGAVLKSWAVINYDFRTSMDDVRKFVSNMTRMASEKGMQMAQPFDFYHYKGRTDPVPINDLNQYKRSNPDIQLIMCVLSGRSKAYGAIKKAGDTEVGIITQCVQGMNVQKCNPQTIGNILLKINAKMGGTNNIISLRNNMPLVMFTKKPELLGFMVMGADVNHPPAGGDKAIPSVAAVVGSFGHTATKYAVERRTQYHRVEVIQDLTEITMNLLKTYYKNTNCLKPSRIIMYRDGVSESQFFEVLATEMMAMRAACSRLQDGYEPGITFICVQKRHHTRLFCADSRDSVGKSGNVPPGTIVDKDIVHPTETDFFLCSHQGIQGTSRPTHYHLLWDDNDLSVNELQQFTYRLCHVYSRCTKSVSIPAPVYYAHLAAFRGKVYIGEFLDESEAGSVVSGGSSMLERKQHEITLATNISFTNSMAKTLHYI